MGRLTFDIAGADLLNDYRVNGKRSVAVVERRIMKHLACLVGHASIATTLNIYTHVVDASHRKAIEEVERELFPTVPKSPDRLADAAPVSDAVN